MTTNDDDRARVGGVEVASLRAAAEAATPGPWKRMIDDHGRDGLDVGVWADKAMGYVIEDIATGNPNHIFDATYIAAASPDVVLALLDEVEALRVMRDRLATAAVEQSALVSFLTGVGSRPGNEEEVRKAQHIADGMWRVLDGVGDFRAAPTRTDPAPTAQVGAEGRGEGL